MTEESACKIVALPGDGIGPEVTDAAMAVLSVICNRFDLTISVDHHIFGGAAIDGDGDPFPDETKEACLAADAVFLGAVGGPKWDAAARQGGARPEAGLLALRKALGTFANLRPTRNVPGLEHLSPLREELIEGLDLLIVRELTGGLYFGDRQEGQDVAEDTCRYERHEIERVVRIAFEAARERTGRLASIDKANVLATSRLWRSVVDDLHREEFSDIEVSHILVDAAAMKLIQDPGSFDVIVTENLFGDILSDEASVLAGSIGLAPSASLGGKGRGLYEPIHGSAPDIAGQNIANPAGAILSVAMMLRHSFGSFEAAIAIEDAVDRTLAKGILTADLGGEVGTSEFTDEVIRQLAS
ncbi:MAG: 3-isopropylmalate dehydrogenase [Pseudomonadota bacterium]